MTQASAPEPVIVVTALPAPAADKALAVVTIDDSALRRSPSTQLDQLLKSVAGLQLFRRSDARSGHPTSQGVTLRALGGNAASRALLLLDGVPQADPFGGWVNWPAYDPASLAEVRVTRGGGSVAAGPGALAGVIELSSRAAIARPLGELAIGSRATLAGDLLAGARLGPGWLSLGGRYERSDGFVPVVAAQRGPADIRAPYQQASVHARLVEPLSDATEAQFAARLFSDERQRGLAFTANRTRGADASLRLVGRGAIGWTALAYVQWRTLSSSFASVNAARTLATRVSLQDDVPSRAFGGSADVRLQLGGTGQLRLGGDARLARGHSHEFYAFAAGTPSRQRDSGGRAATYGLFAEASHDAGRATLTLAGRLDRWRIDGGFLTENILSTGAVLTDARYPARAGWRPTARAGASVPVSHLLTLRAAAYLGWRLPTLNELFRPFRAGPDATAANPLLRPERLSGAEVGAHVGKGRFTLDATAFANRLSDPIVNVTLASGPGLFPGVGFVSAAGKYRQRRNARPTVVHGVELDGRAAFGRWSLSAGYSLADARAAAGLRPAQTPRHSASATFGWDGAVSLALTVRHVGGQYEDDLNTQRLAPAATLDAFASVPLARRLKLTLRGENLLDAMVAAGISSDGIIERATPRTVLLGLRLGD